MADGGGTRAATGDLHRWTACREEVITSVLQYSGNNLKFLEQIKLVFKNTLVHDQSMTLRQS